MNRQLISKLVEVDDEINMKNGTIQYLENGDKLLDGFILPMIKFINESEDFDKDKLMEAFNLIKVIVNQTSDLSESLEIFCIKYQLPREMRDFDKKDYAHKIDELKSKLGN